MASCKICSGKVSHFATARLLQRHDVTYYLCGVCGFLQTEAPYWLEEAYSDAIAPTDIGLANRNINLALLTRSLIRLCFNPDGRFLDYAGGYGLLVRLMRDAGYDFRLYDRYCRNIFAGGFAEAEGELGTYELITAFEFLEHVHDPLQEMERLLGHSRNILFSTEIYPETAPLPGEWWYFGMDHGQHISFYTVRSLRMMARRLSLNYYTNGASIHLFTERTLSPLLFNLALRHPIASLVDLLFKRESLLAPDHAAQSGNYQARP